MYKNKVNRKEKKIESKEKKRTISKYKPKRKGKLIKAYLRRKYKTLQISKYKQKKKGK